MYIHHNIKLVFFSIISKIWCLQIGCRSRNIKHSQNCVCHFFLTNRLQKNIYSCIYNENISVIWSSKHKKVHQKTHIIVLVKKSQVSKVRDITSPHKSFKITVFCIFTFCNSAVKFSPAPKTKRWFRLPIFE